MSDDKYDITKVNALKAYNDMNDVLNKKEDNTIDTQRINNPTFNYCFTEVSYRNGQARLVVEPIPNKNGERYVICLNPTEAMSLLKNEKKSRAYQLPPPRERGE